MPGWKEHHRGGRGGSTQRKHQGRKKGNNSSSGSKSSRGTSKKDNHNHCHKTLQGQVVLGSSKGSPQTKRSSSPSKHRPPVDARQRINRKRAGRGEPIADPLPALLGAALFDQASWRLEISHNTGETLDERFSRLNPFVLHKPAEIHAAEEAREQETPESSKDLQERSASLLARRQRTHQLNLARTFDKLAEELHLAVAIDESLNELPQRRQHQ